MWSFYRISPKAENDVRNKIPLIAVEIIKISTWNRRRRISVT